MQYLLRLYRFELDYLLSVRLHLRYLIFALGCHSSKQPILVSLLQLSLNQTQMLVKTIVSKSLKELLPLLENQPEPILCSRTLGLLFSHRQLALKLPIMGSSQINIDHQDHRTNLKLAQRSPDENDKRWDCCQL